MLLANFYLSIVTWRDIYKIVLFVYLGAACDVFLLFCCFFLYNIGIHLAFVVTNIAKSFFVGTAIVYSICVEQDRLVRNTPRLPLLTNSVAYRMARVSMFG